MPENASNKVEGADEVTLINVSRRPLVVQIPGVTVRLGPGGRQNVPKSLLATTEIRRLCEQRLLTVSAAVGEPVLAEPDSGGAAIEQEAPADAELAPPDDVPEAATEAPAESSKVRPSSAPPEGRAPKQHETGAARKPKGGS